MELLTVTINDNIIETLDFERKDYTNSFILPSNGVVNLITIPLENPDGNKSEVGAFVQKTGGRKCFFPCKLAVVKTSRDEKNGIDRYEIELELELDPQRSEYQTKQNGDKYLVDKNENENKKPQFIFIIKDKDKGVLSLRNIRPECVSDIKVTIKIHDEGNETYSACRTLFLSPAKQVKDVILDFGSEATQLSISNRGTINDVNNRVSLFDIMWDELGDPNKQEDRNTCMQRDASDENLYRSRFFVKKRIKNSRLLEIEASGDPKDNELIKLLTLSKDGESLKENYIPLPNTKIASFGGVTVDKVDIEIVQNGRDRTVRLPITKVGKNFFYRSSINAFLRKAVDKIGWDNSLQTESHDKVRLISFHILMPNVYDYCKIHEMLEVLKEDIQDIVKEIDENIIGFEVTAVSESDASLLGNVALSNPADFPAGKYLVLDAGRGTLDFSIVKHDNKAKVHPFQNLYRDGIIGAGNALTYAMLLVILESIISNESAGTDHTKEIQDYIFSNILGLDKTGKENGGGDSAKLVELMELVDKYKIMYSNYLSNSSSYSQKCSSIPINTSFKGLRLDGLVKQMNNIVDGKIFIEDPKNYLERSMRQLVDAVIGRLKDRFTEDGDSNEPDYVVFAGRGFMFKPFKDMMEESLRNCFPEIEKKHFSTNDNNVSDKNVCLVIANYLKDGRYDTRLLGQPYMLHSAGPRMKNVKPKDKKETDNGFLLSKLKQYYNESKLKKYYDKLKLKKYRDRLTKGPNVSGGVSVGVGVSVQKGYRPHEDMNLANFSKGVTLRAQYNTDQILIGNIRYDVPHSVAGDFDLFFANGKIWIRPVKDLAVSLEGGIDFGGNRIFESLFPYVSVTKPEEVAIPSELSKGSTYTIPMPKEVSSTNEEPKNEAKDLLK